VSQSPIVDVHVHVLPTDESDEEPERDPYEIWEYGTKDDVEICELAGTIGQVSEAMRAAKCDHFVVVNMFVPDNEIGKMAAASSPGAPPPTVATCRDELAERLVAFNTWALDLAAGRADMTIFVAMDPSVLGGAAGAAHLRWAHERGALGVKVHPVMQRFRPDDPRMDEIFTACEELGMGVIAHAGASRSGTEWAEPDAFAALLDAHPRLKLVLAHLGGGRWKQAQQLAEAYPAVCFDLCEIIAWAGAPGAPTHDELGQMIKGIGSERVMFGTDFPWYQVDRTIDQVMALPHLSEDERRGILGTNAVSHLGLPVAV
jgi:predicted TIM-barrel fold metal-dependent hydrolase